MPVVEIATFEPSSAYIADRNLDLKALRILQQSKGFLGAWTGCDVENRKTAYVVVTWDTLESHTSLPSSPLFPKLAESFRTALGGQLKIINIEFDNDHAIAFDAPVTEILVHQLKEGKTKEDSHAEIAEIKAHYANAKGVRQPQAHGEVVESPGTFYTVIGWDSQEAAADAVDLNVAQGEQLLSVVEITRVNVLFEKRTIQSNTSVRDTLRLGPDNECVVMKRPSDFSRL